MIALHILTKTIEQAEEIARLLLRKRLILNAQLLPGIEYRYMQKRQVIACRTTLLVGKTKGLLFQDIDNLLRELYPDNLPEIYSLPIVNMDWEQGQALREETSKV